MDDTPDRRALKARVCDAVEAGWRLEPLGGRPGFPTRQTVYAWARRDPDFARRLREARAGRRGAESWRRAGPVFDEARAQALLARVRAGETISGLVGTPGMPSRAHFTRWKQERPDFARALDVALRARTRLPRVVPYDEAACDRIIVRLSRGELMGQVLSDPAAPRPAVLRDWRRRRPDLDGAIRTAQLAGLRNRRRARRRLTPDLFDQILERLVSGESLRQMDQDPSLPRRATLRRWAREDADFAHMIAWGLEEGRQERIARKAEAVAPLADILRDLQRAWAARLRTAAPDEPPTPGRSRAGGR